MCSVLDRKKLASLSQTRKTMRMPSQSLKLAAKGTTYGVQDGLVMRCALCVWGGGGGWIHYHSFSATFPLHVIRTSCINTLCHHQSSVSPSILCVTINPLCHHQSSVSPSILFVIVLACVLYLLRANLTAVQGGAQNVGTEGNVVSHGRLQQSLQGGEMHYIHNYVFYVRT